MTQKLTGEISILVQIDDIPALIATARERYLALCLGEFSAEQMIPDGDVRAALHILFDPSIAPNGCTILDSTCELSHNVTENPNDPPEAVAEIIPDGDIAAALRMLFDPGQSPDGCTIIDSMASTCDNP